MYDNEDNNVKLLCQIILSEGSWTSEMVVVVVVCGQIWREADERARERSKAKENPCWMLVSDMVLKVQSSREPVEIKKGKRSGLQGSDSEQEGGLGNLTLFISQVI